MINDYKLRSTPGAHQIDPELLVISLEAIQNVISYLVGEAICCSSLEVPRLCDVRSENTSLV
jgi:hypothetical protein